MLETRVTGRAVVVGCRIASRAPRVLAAGMQPAPPVTWRSPRFWARHARPLYARPAQYARLPSGTRPPTAASESVNSTSTQTDEGKWQDLVVISSGCMFICAAHRSVFSVLAPTLAASFHLTSTDLGYLQAAALTAYLLGLIPAGRLADSVGGVQVLLSGLLLWSIATACATTAAAAPLHAVPLLLASRLAFGLTSSCIMPAISALAATQFPKPRRASAVSLIYALFNIGGVVGMAAAPVVGANAGWVTVFLGSAALGVVWAGVGGVMLQRTAGQQQQQQQLHVPGSGSATNGLDGGRSAASLGSSPGAPAAEATAVPWYREKGMLLQVGVLCWSHAVIGACFFVLQNWIPMYLTSRDCTSPAALGAMSSLPWLGAAGASLLAGAVSDRLLQRGWKVLDIRRAMHTVSTLGSSAALLPLVLAPSLPPAAAAVCLGACLACYGSSFSGFHAYVQDVTARDAGTMLGVTNTWGVLMGIAANLTTGWVVDAAGSYTPVFAALAGLYVTSWALFVTVLKGEPIHL